MRRRRTRTSPRIGVTGGSSGLGRALLQRLAGSPELGEVDLVGLDRSTAPIDGVSWRPGYPRDRRLAARLDAITTVVHLALCFDPAADPRSRRDLNVRGTAALLDAARVAGVDRVVLVTGVDVYGALPGTSIPLAEDAPLRAEPDSALLGDLVEVERLASHATRTGLEVVVLRPCTLVGGALGPAYDGAQLLSLTGSRLLAARGVEPLWQLCHADDLLAVLELATLGRVSGAMAVGCDGWLTQREVERLSGLRRLELPGALAVSTAERLHRIGATSGSPRELDRLLFPLVVEPRRARAAGWLPAWTNAEALSAHLELRPPVPGRAGTYTAAGATVALLGTAALVRRSRERRGR